MSVEFVAWNAAGRRAATAYGWVTGVGGKTKSAQCWAKTSPPTAQESAKSTNSGKTNHVRMRVISVISVISGAKLATVGSV